MNSIELLEAFNKATKVKFSDMKAFSEEQGGIYGWFENGKLIYIGKATNLKRRLVGDHMTGISSKSTFANCIRIHRLLSITHEDIANNSNLHNGDIEAKKIRDYMDSCMEVITIVCNPEELLEDVKQKPEKFLHTYFKGPDLLNNPKSK
jgi:hypothetical protein